MTEFVMIWKMAIGQKTDYRLNLGDITFKKTGIKKGYREREVALKLDEPKVISFWL